MYCIFLLFLIIYQTVKNRNYIVLLEVAKFTATKNMNKALYFIVERQTFTKGDSESFSPSRDGQVLLLLSTLSVHFPWRSKAGALLPVPHGAEVQGSASTDLHPHRWRAWQPVILNSSESKYNPALSLVLLTLSGRHIGVLLCGSLRRG